MLLADLGAEVIQVSRSGGAASPDAQVNDLTSRSKRQIVVDLKHPRGAEVVLRLAAASDELIEGYTLGVAERFGGRPCGLPSAQPGPGLPANDRVGPRRSPDGERRTRHRVYRAHRRAACDRPGQTAARLAPRLGDGTPGTSIGAFPRGGSRRSAHSCEVLAGPGFHDVEELLMDGAVIQHATGSDLE